MSFTLPGNPVPAARPRFRTFTTKGGQTITSTYYAGAYKRYTDEAPKAIPESPHKFPKGTPVRVNVTFFVKRPQKPANPYPVGDVDNYAKAVLDAITENGTYWHDDTQVTTLVAEKVYMTGEPMTQVSIEEDRA